jgi:hypothetical protein
MRKPTSLLLVIVAAMHMNLWAQDQPQNVRLSGHVYESDGKALGGAKITLFPLETGIGGPIMPSALTGEDGAYFMVAPPLGKTRILASLEGRGYPNSFYKIFASPEDHFPEVNLIAGAALREVDIHLAPPDGVVEGAVIDKENGATIRFAQIALRSAAEPTVFLSSGVGPSGHFQYALPNMPISVSISAPGYNTWVYIEPSTHAQYLKLNSSEHRTLSVELVKTASGATASYSRSPTR